MQIILTDAQRLEIRARALRESVESFKSQPDRQRSVSSITERAEAFETWLTR